MCLFLSELNKMEVWSTRIGNTYLESYTYKKVYVVTGDQFGDWAGHKLIVARALYGLRSSGLCWWERFPRVLLEMGLIPSKAENDIWILPKGDHYEYITCYVEKLKDHYKFNVTGPISDHLGANFE